LCFCQAGNLTKAIKMTGDAYNNIGKMFEEQPKLDWEPLADQMHIYKGILASFPDILQVHKVKRGLFSLLFRSSNQINNTQPFLSFRML